MAVMAGSYVSCPTSGKLTRRRFRGRRWPPERVPGAGNVRVGACYAGAHEPWLAARQQHSPQHGPERRGVDASAVTRGEVRGHGIGLLRGEAALLDGEIDRVVSGVDIGESLPRPCSSTGMKSS